MNSLPHASQVTWPTERFYWSVLNSPGLGRAGVLPLGLLGELQDDLPVPVEDLHAVLAPTGDGRLLVCAARRGDLGEVDSSVLALCPDGIPDAIALPIDCSALNLLVGQFEPRPLRRARLRRHLAAAAAVLTLTAVAAIGLWRRAEHWTAVAREAQTASAGVLRQIAPSATSASLKAELAHLRPTTEAAERLRPTGDAARRLAALLHAWPVNLPSKPQSVSVTPSATTVSLTVEGDAAPFLASFRPPAGWRAEEPRLNTAGTITRLTLLMHPPAEETSP